MSTATKSAGSGNATTKSSSSKPFTPRPNFSKLHSKPLPVEVYPIPTFVPHNPLSVLRALYVLVSHYVFPPSSHPQTIHTAYFSAETTSIVVTDQKSIRALWESGFFGKGSLSRSEPNWLAQERKRLGLDGGLTSEMVTQQRRQERIDMKNERARLQREAVEEQLNAERAAAGVTQTPERPVDEVSLSASAGTKELLPSESNGNAPNAGMQTLDEVHNSHAIASEESDTQHTPLEDSQIYIKDQEHLQLSLEEAFFLVYALGVLLIKTSEGAVTAETASLLQLFRRQSYCPPKSTQELGPDDPFLVNYVVYHHFRSLGWVVRPGNKFSVDFLLYKGGPVFSHAEFAVVILPSYVDEWWFSAPERRAVVTKKRDEQQWWWVQNTNRVQAQVLKTLVLVYVEIPTPGAIGPLVTDGDVGGILKQYKVREVVTKRWTPNRQRE